MIKVFKFKKIAPLGTDLQFVMLPPDSEDFFIVKIPILMTAEHSLEEIFEGLLVNNEVVGPFLFENDESILPEAK